MANAIINFALVYDSFNSQPIAMKQGSTLSYLHHDHLGSLVAVSNASGQEVGSVRYWPFGGLRTSTGSLPTDRLFTGQIRDLGDDRLSFFKARYYDATIGKFHTPDTVAPDPNYPTRLNHYAYADNNPLKLRDSTGHYSEIPDGMVTPSILITTPPPAPSQPSAPLVNVAPPRLPSGPLIFTGQLNTGVKHITTQQDLELGGPLIQTQSDQRPTIFTAKGRPQDPIEKTYEMRMSEDWPHNFLKQVVEKYGINLRGSGKKVTLSYVDEGERPIHKTGGSAESEPDIVKIYDVALDDSQELAKTIAHELNHARASSGR